MSNPDNFDSAASQIPTYARALSIVSLCASILFALISFITWVSILTISSYDVLIALIIGMPISLGGSFFLAFLPTLVLKFFVKDPRVNWSLWISGASAIIGSGVWIFIATMY